MGTLNPNLLSKHTSLILNESAKIMPVLGKHLLMPPGHTGTVPSGYNVGRSSSFRAIGAVRAIPQNGDVPGAIALLQKVKVHPLQPSTGWTEPTWKDMTPVPQDTTPLAFAVSAPPLVLPEQLRALKVIVPVAVRLPPTKRGPARRPLPCTASFAAGVDVPIPSSPPSFTWSK